MALREEIVTNLQDRLKEIAANSTYESPVDRLLAELDEDTADILRAVLRNPTVSTRSIHDELRHANYRIGRDTLASYRRNQGI